MPVQEIKTRADLSKAMCGMGTMKKQTRNSVVCSLLGHSKIHTTCFGYYYCARCDAQVGDALASIYPGAEEAVIVGHNCKKCRANYKKLDWRAKLYVSNPFTDKK